MFLKVQVIVTWCRPMPSHSFESFLQAVWVRSSGLMAGTASVPSAIQQCVHLLFLPGLLLLFRETVNYFHLQTDLPLPVPFLKSTKRTAGHQPALLAHAQARVQSLLLACGQPPEQAALESPAKPPAGRQQERPGLPPQPGLHFCPLRAVQSLLL